jgi:hypothetical protein
VILRVALHNPYWRMRLVLQLPPGGFCKKGSLCELSFDL